MCSIPKKVAFPSRSLFAQAIIAPEEAERRASALADEIRRRAEEARAGSRLLSATERLDPSAAQKIANHQMPYWTERLTLGFLRSQESAGASVKPAAVGYDLRWPNGDTCLAAVFSRDDADQPRGDADFTGRRARPGADNQSARLRTGPTDTLDRHPRRFRQDERVWSLWRISLHTAGGREQRFSRFS